MALLVVDMQEPFLRVIPDSEALVKRVCFAIEAAALFRMHIFITEQSPEKLGPTHSDILESASQGSSVEGGVFPKDSFCALQQTDLSRRLNNHGVEHLLLAGIETPICIYQTALTALEREMDITVLSDGIGARRPMDSQHVLETLREAGSYVLPAETVFYSLMKTATHPAFRQFTKLVKAHA